MERTRLNYGARTILNHQSAYTLARLRANPALSEELTMAQGAQDALMAATQNKETAERETMAAASSRDVRRYALDVALRALRGAVLAEVINNRLCDAYRVLFPDGFSAILRGSADDELAQARQIVAKLPDPQPAEIKDALSKVSTAIDGLAAALADHQTAYTAERAAAAALMTEKAHFGATYDAIYARLVIALGNWRLAETYFWHSRRGTGTDQSTSGQGQGQGTQPQAVPAPAQPAPLPQAAAA